MASPCGHWVDEFCAFPAAAGKELRHSMTRRRSEIQPCGIRHGPGSPRLAVDNTGQSAYVRSVIRIFLVVVVMIFAVMMFGKGLELPGGVASVTKLVVGDSDKPTITNADVTSHITGRTVQVWALRGAGLPSRWTFEPDDPRQVTILDAEANGDESTVDVSVMTDSNLKRGEREVHVAGTLRLHYEWSAGKWTLAQIENVSFRYSFSRG
jgi:hypothetical protein